MMNGLRFIIRSQADTDNYRIMDNLHALCAVAVFGIVVFMLGIAMGRSCVHKAAGCHGLDGSTLEEFQQVMFFHFSC